MAQRQLSKREIATRLKDLEKRTRAAKENLYTLEAAIAAMPADFQETRIRNRNVIPPPDDADLFPRRSPRKSLRQEQQRLRRARSNQALWALVCLGMLAGFVFWFYTQLKTHNLVD